MRASFKTAFALFFGACVSAVAIHELHAQGKPVAYAVAEIEVSDENGFTKEFGPLAIKALTEAGGKQIVRGGKTVSIFGDAPKGRVTMWQFESLEKIQAAYASPAFIEAKKIGDKYAKFRVYAVEGLPQ